MLENWISEECSVYKFSKIFTASIDGWTIDLFHEICDFIGPTVVIIKTKHDKVLGGFTKLHWNENKRNDSHKSTFVFSLDVEKKFKCNSIGSIN